jgi:hypothetical protein
MLLVDSHRDEGGTVAKPRQKRGREVPRPFEFHWGGGQIVEEASYIGRFQRSPMMIDGKDSFEGLRAALKETPTLRAMLKKLVS